MRTAKEMIQQEIIDKLIYGAATGGIDNNIINIHYDSCCLLIEKSQREALEEAAKIAEKPDRLFERGETINLENQAGRIFASIRKLAEELK